VGTVTGLLHGAARRPSRLAAAIEADRQLGLRDLLGTAATVGADPADAWARTVLAVADQRCRRHTPSQVVLRRYGSRAWGGLGLAASLVLTLAAMLSDPGAERAAASRVPGTSVAAGRSSMAATNPPARLAPHTAPGAHSAPSHDSRTLDPAAEDASPDPDRGHVSPPERAGGPGRRSSGNGPDGRGSGVSTSGKRGAALSETPSRPPSRPSAPTPGHAPANAAPAGGGGLAASDSGSGNDRDAGAGTSVTSGSPTRAAPWESSTWPARAAAAREAAENGRVPDAYRDLVRDYFDR
jgi:hypothetical protein